MTDPKKKRKEKNLVRVVKGTKDSVLVYDPWTLSLSTLEKFLGKSSMVGNSECKYENEMFNSFLATFSEEDLCIPGPYFIL